MLTARKFNAEVLMITFLFILVLFPGSFNIEASIDFEKEVLISSTYISHDEIEITSDTDFIAYGFPGDGSEINPYRIEGYNFSSSEFGETAITIKYVTKHFVIQDCYFDMELGAGVYLWAIATNISLISNNVFYCSNYALRTEGFSSSTVTDNTFYSGFYRAFASNSMIVNNTFDGIFEDDIAIEMGNTSGMKLYNNTLNDCGIDFRGEYLDTFTLENNKINSKDLGWFVNANDQLIDSQIYGQIVIDNSNNITIKNQVIRNTFQAIYIKGGSDIKLYNNTFEENQEGINLDRTEGIVIEDNFINANTENGINMWSSFDSINPIQIRNNTFEANNEFGIFVNSANPVIANNTFTKSGIFIDAYVASFYKNYIIIENNTLNGEKIEYVTDANNIVFNAKDVEQFICVDSSNLTVKNCLFEQSSHNFIAYYSDNLSFTSNQYENCTASFELRDCSNIDISRETFNNCEDAILIRKSGYVFNGISYDVANISFTENKFTNTKGMSVMISDAQSVKILENCFSNDTYSFYISEINYLEIENCTFTGNGDVRGRGLYVVNCDYITIQNITSTNFDSGIILSNSDHSYINNSIFNMNTVRGISLSNLINATIHNSEIADNEIGIELVASNCSIYSNSIKSNTDYGIYIRSGSHNRVFHNDFYLNGGTTSQAYDDGSENLWYNSVNNEGNHWSDWNGVGSYLIDGSAGAMDLYPFSDPLIPEFTTKISILVFISFFGTAIIPFYIKKRK